MNVELQTNVNPVKTKNVAHEKLDIQRGWL